MRSPAPSAWVSPPQSVKLRGREKGAHCARRGSITAVIFEDYVERVLAPTLLPGQVMILDNRGAHNAARTREVEHAIW